MTTAATEDHKEWKIIYPVYLNSKKKRSEGRRIGINSACENPTAQEIQTVCTALKIPCVVEVSF
jgi:signal recognition particle subunit SRP19